MSAHTAVVSFKVVFYDIVYTNFSTDEFKGQICRDYSNCVISSLLLPDPVQPPTRSHDLSGTTTEEARTQPQSSIELPMSDLCCSSCRKAGVGSCSSRKTDVSESKKQDVEKHERELRDQTQSLEEAKGVHMSEAGDAVNEKNSGERDVSSVDPNFSNKDDVITRDRVELKEEGTSDSHTSSGNVLKDKEEGDATKTDIKSNIQLQESPPAETDTKVRKSVAIPCTVITIGIWVEQETIPVWYVCQVVM